MIFLTPSKKSGDTFALSNMTPEDAERLGMDSYSDSGDIIENFPQSTPMNVMYSDVNGNSPVVSLSCNDNVRFKL